MGISLSFSLDVFRGKHAVTYDIPRRIAAAAAAAQHTPLINEDMIFNIFHLSVCLKKLYAIVMARIRTASSYVWPKRRHNDSSPQMDPWQMGCVFRRATPLSRI